MIDPELRAKYRDVLQWKNLSKSMEKLSQDFAQYSNDSQTSNKETQAELTKYMIQRFDFQIALQVEMLKTLKSIERKLAKK